MAAFDSLGTYSSFMNCWEDDGTTVYFPDPLIGHEHRPNADAQGDATVPQISQCLRILV